MLDVIAIASGSEQQFAELVDSISEDPDRLDQLAELLREEHPAYDQRGAAAIVRMRGWVLLALSRVGTPDNALIYVLEELETGIHAYLVAAAARALRCYREPSGAFAPFVMRALSNVRYHDEPISFDGYGEYSDSCNDTSAVGELLATLTWLGPHARGVIAEVEALNGPRGGLSRELLDDLQLALEAIRADPTDDVERSGAQIDDELESAEAHDCCSLPPGLNSFFSWARGFRRKGESIEQTVFEDQDGAATTFQEFFQGQPSIVAFFYTRCENPLKCSLTVTKLARMQKLLAKRGLADQVHTAAISYDPQFDHPNRLRRYGEARDVTMNARHRMLRSTDGADSLRKHFQLGVNFVESLINRHRIELYVLDAEGNTAASFQRIHWDEQQVVDRAVALIEEQHEQPAVTGQSPDRPAGRAIASPVLGTLASLGVIFFPKCPFCWAAYLSLFGVAGLEKIPYSPWLLPVLVAVLLINLGCIWLRGCSTGRMTGFYLALVGVVAIVGSRFVSAAEMLAIPGIALIVAGSLYGAMVKRS